MSKAPPRRAARRSAPGKAARGKASRGKSSRGTPHGADFCALAQAALRRGEPDAISDKQLQRVLSAAVKVYAAKVERRGHDVVPYQSNSVTATETVVTACGMIRAADLNMFDVAIWFHRPPGIE